MAICPVGERMERHVPSQAKVRNLLSRRTARQRFAEHVTVLLIMGRDRFLNQHRIDGIKRLLEQLLYKASWTFRMGGARLPHIWPMSMAGT